MNLNLMGFHGFAFVSYVISAIIASERCFCVISPMTSQTRFTTRTMGVVLVVVFVVVTGGHFVVATKFRAMCAFDPVRQVVFKTFAGSTFYQDNQVCTCIRVFLCLIVRLID
jgi:hypothetical protein